MIDSEEKRRLFRIHIRHMAMVIALETLVLSIESDAVDPARWGMDKETAVLEIHRAFNYVDDSDPRLDFV